LKREAPAFLAMLIDGCIEYQRDGLCPPPSLQTAGREMVAEADIFGRWLAEKTEYIVGVDTPRTALQASYDAFRHAEGDQSAIKASEFTQLFRCDQRFNRGARPYVDGVQVRGIGNIRLKVSQQVR
jgi:phage/plasmid-associated DNA primase